MGRPHLTQHGCWMAAVLSCGPSAVLSHLSAAALWKLVPIGDHDVEVSVADRARSKTGIVVKHRSFGADEVTRQRGIPVTTPVCTLIDIATQLGRDQLEAAVNEADKRNLADPEQLRSALDQVTRRPGVGVLRELLDRRTFTLTDSELERRFIPLALSAGLSLPLSGQWVNGFKVDFYWPDLGLVVETTGSAITARPPSRRGIDCVTTNTSRPA